MEVVRRSAAKIHNANIGAGQKEKGYIGAGKVPVQHWQRGRLLSTNLAWCLVGQRVDRSRKIIRSSFLVSVIIINLGQLLLRRK